MFIIYLYYQFNFLFINKVKIYLILKFYTHDIFIKYYLTNSLFWYLNHC